MNRALFIRIGEALYGPQWQSEMARQLGVAVRTVQRWAAGEGPIPAGVAGDLKPLIRARKKDFESLLRELD